MSDFDKWFASEHPETNALADAKDLAALGNRYAARSAWNAAIALMREQSEVVAWIAPSSLESLRICRKDEHNGFVEAWMRRDDERTIPLCVAWQTMGADGNWVKITREEFVELRKRGIGKQRELSAAPAGVDVPPEDHRNEAGIDAELLGTGFLVDGKRVAPERVEMIIRLAAPAGGDVERDADFYSAGYSNGYKHAAKDSARAGGDTSCDMRDLCIGCTPRNADGSCTDSAPAGGDECCATFVGHSMGPHGPDGERQCKYCGEPAPAGSGEVSYRWLDELRDRMDHCISAADEGEDYAVPRDYLDAMTTLGLMKKVGRGKWSPTEEGEAFAQRKPTIPVIIYGKTYEVPIPVQLHIVALEDAAALIRKLSQGAE